MRGDGFGSAGGPEEQFASGRLLTFNKAITKREMRRHGRPPYALPAETASTHVKAMALPLSDVSHHAADGDDRRARAGLERRRRHRLRPPVLEGRPRSRNDRAHEWPRGDADSWVHRPDQDALSDPNDAPELACRRTRRPHQGTSFAECRGVACVRQPPLLVVESRRSLSRSSPDLWFQVTSSASSGTPPTS